VSRTTTGLLPGRFGRERFSPFAAQPHSFFKRRIIGEHPSDFVPPRLLLRARRGQIALEPCYLAFERGSPFLEIYGTHLAFPPVRIDEANMDCVDPAVRRQLGNRAISSSTPQDVTHAGLVHLKRLTSLFEAQSLRELGHSRRAGRCPRQDQRLRTRVKLDERHRFRSGRTAASLAEPEVHPLSRCSSSQPGIVPVASSGHPQPSLSELHPEASRAANLPGR
jgi:hypothetical protein